MKKIKFILITLFLFFCFMGKEIPKANAAVTEKILFQNSICKPGEFYVLKKGYYIFIGEDKILKSNLIGDYAYHLVENDFCIDPSVFGEEIPFDFQYQSQMQAMAQKLQNLVSEDTLKRGIAFVTVNSTAILSTEMDDLNHLYCYYLEVDEPVKDITLSGGMTHFVNVDHKIPLEDIKSRYTASDNVDGDLTDKIKFQTNYQESSSIGTYFIMASVTDSSSNTITTVDYIIVKDFTAPTIQLLETEKEIEVFQEFTLKDIKPYFVFSDNITSRENLKITYIDHFNDSFNVVGDYTISAYAKDLDGNTSETKTFTIRVKDYTAPIIALRDGGNEIISDHILNDSEIKALMMVEDNYYTITNESIEVIENTCTGMQGKEYRIKVQVYDESGNRGESTFRYYLTDNTSPIIMVNKALYIEAGIIYTNDQIIAMLKEAGILNLDAQSIELSSILVNSSEEMDIYELCYKEEFADGSSKDGSVKLNIFKTNSLQKENNQNAYYWFLLLLIPLLVLIVFIYKKRKLYEKD